jgi:O-Antigen ligase
MTLILCMQLLMVVSLVVASRRSLENALPLLCFFVVVMPLEARLVIPGLFDINTIRVLLLTLLILYLGRRPPISPGSIPLKRLMFLQIGCGAWSTIYSLSVATSAKQLISQVLEFYLLYYLLVKIITSRRTIYNILFAIAMAIGVCCICGLLEAYATWSILKIFPSNLWITYNGGIDPLYVDIGRGLRIRSTFPHPILFGDALAMTIPLTLYLLTMWEKRWQRGLLWVVTVLMFWALYKTSSRGPWLATGLCAVLLFLMIHNDVRKYLVALSFLAVLVAVTRPAIWQTIEGLYQSSTDPASPVGSSYFYRVELPHAITDAVATDPERALLGYGLGTFREFGLDINLLNSVQHWYTCDNNWAEFLYESGYIGLMLITILLLQPLLIAMRSYRQLAHPDNYLSGVLFISLGGFYFLLLSVAGYNWGQQGYMAWILIALAISHPRVVRHGDLFEDMDDEEIRGAENDYDLDAA